MNLLFPQFLYGLLAIAIPIIVHLFNFRRTKKVYFSNNRFLQDIKESNSSRLRLKHLLVLISRILFIVFLVLAFAQPYISSENNYVPGGHVKIYIDNSFSMSNQTGDDIPAIDQAVVFTESIISQYPGSTRFQLFTNEFDVSSESVKSFESFRDALTEVGLTPVSRSFSEIIGRMRGNSTQESELKTDYYLISDFQRSTFQNLSEATLDTASTYATIPLKFLNNHNLFIDSVYLGNPFLLKDNANELVISVRNTSAEAVEDVILKLTLNGVQVASAAISIGPQTAKEVNFELNLDLQDQNRGTVSFEDFPVTFDNEYFFTLTTSEVINIIELYQGETAPTVLSNVYANDQLFEFNSYNIDNFDYNLLNTANLVILNEVDFVNEAIQPMLNQYVANGRALTVIFGESPELANYKSIGLPENFTVLQSIGRTQSDLAQPDYNNPFFENIFDSSEERIEMPTATNTVTWRSQGSRILDYQNRTPFISGSSLRNVFYIGTPLKDEFTNFHRQALFVPVMYRLAAMSLTSGEKLSYQINDSQLQLKGLDMKATDILKLQREDEEIIPSQYVVDNTVFLEVPKFTLRPGFYELVKGGVVLRSVAFNFNEEESYLDQMSANQLSDLFAGDVKIYSEANIGAFEDELKEVFTGKELWKYCLGLALFFLLLEIVFIKFL